MTQHFMREDCLAILTGFLLFPVIGFFPGYALGALTGVLRFRSRSLAFRLAASAPLSVAIGPILAYTAGRWFSMPAVWGVYGLLCAYGLYALVRAFREGRPRFPGRWQIFAALMGVWLLMTFSLADLQIGRKSYFSVIAFDYAVRTAFTQAISTFGIPAQNPFFFPGHAVALRYHYFWIILCALLHQLGGRWMDARQAFIAGTLWCGIALICLVPLYLRVFSPGGAGNLSRRSAIGIALLGVTGLDLLPAFLMIFLAHIGLIGGISPSVEWWNNQVDSWIYTMLWEPHYLCAVVACLVGFLILWDIPPDAGRRCRMMAAGAAGAAFATSVGAGIYVALVFAGFLALWTVLTLWKRWYRETRTLAVSGVVATALAFPYLAGLRASSGHGTGGGARLLQLTVREFDLGEIFLKLTGHGRPAELLAGDMLLLPLNYFLELGFFFVVGWMVCSRFRRRGRPATRPELAAFAMAGTSIVICTFVRSGLIANNDLGWRGFLIAQFVLLLWAADLLAESPLRIPPARKELLAILLLLGVAGVLYDLTILRFFPVWSDAGLVPKLDWMARDNRLGERTYYNREAYEWLRARTPATAIIQQNPDPTYQDTFYGMYGQRRTIAEDAGCGATFGGDPAACAPIVGRLEKLYASGTAEDFAAACAALPVDVFIAKDTDAAWRDRATWVWTRAPVFQNDFVRLFPCQEVRGGNPLRLGIAKR